MSTTLPPIGLWGASESGKTTYISALYLAFLQAGQEDHDVHNLDDPFYGLHRWSMEPANQEARILINEQSKGLEQGEFPQASIEPRKYQFDFYKRGNPLILDERTHHLNVIDGKGEEIRDPESSFMQHLANCEGILLLIDPSNIDWTKGVATVPSELANDEILTIRQAIDNLFEVLEPYKQKNGFYDVDIAICVTKMDRDDCWPERHNARKFVRELIGQAAYNLLGNRCEQDRYRFFATSVVGRFTYCTEEGGVIERANITDEGGTDKIADLSAWEPYQMLDPLFWLFDRMEIKQRKQPYRRIKPDPDNRFLWAGAYLGKFLIWLVYYLPWRLWRQPCHGVSKWDYLNSYRIRVGQWISGRHRHFLTEAATVPLTNRTACIAQTAQSHLRCLQTTMTTPGRSEQQRLKGACRMIPSRLKIPTGIPTMMTMRTMRRLSDLRTMTAIMRMTIILKPDAKRMRYRGLCCK